MPRRWSVVAVLAAVLVAPVLAQQPASEEPLRVFIRAGEKTHNPYDNGLHDYPSFLGAFSNILGARGARVNGALHFPTQDELANTDVLIIYKGDGGTCSVPERQALEAFQKRGGGLVVLHDGMCSDDAGWFATIAGAAKQHGERNFSAGPLNIKVVDRAHPITTGLQDFTIDDEAFFLLRKQPQMHVLLETALPVGDNAGEVHPQAWTYELPAGGGQSYRSFVWMQGHSFPNFLQPGPRDFILRGIAWAGKRPVDSLLTVREGRGGGGRGAGRGRGAQGGRANTPAPVGRGQ
jgi:trehalose utilization protein